MLKLRALSTISSGLILVAMPWMASAQNADVAYYTHTDVETCRNQGTNTVAGAVLGAAGGFLLSGGRAAPTLVGAAVGGLFGSAMSCTDRTTYMSSVDNALLQRQYWHPYESDTCRVVVLRSGYGPNGEVCRAYHSEYLMPEGNWMSNETTACWVNGMWRHGFDNNYIREVRYQNPQPLIRVVFRPREVIYRDHGPGPGPGPAPFVRERPLIREDIRVDVHDDHYNDRHHDDGGWHDGSHDGWHDGSHEDQMQRDDHGVSQGHQVH